MVDDCSIIKPMLVKQQLKTAMTVMFYNETKYSGLKHSVSRDCHCCILVQDYSYCLLQAWVLNNATVIDHCGHTSNSKTTRRVSTMQQSIQASSIVSVETVIVIF